MDDREVAASHFLDRARGCVLGLAVGDALGPTVEFRAYFLTGPAGGAAGMGTICTIVLKRGGCAPAFGFG
jgi:hypothetical protein